MLRGEVDRLVPAEAGRAWVDGMPEAQFSEVPAVGHCLPLEWPPVATEVEGFLSEFDTF